MPNLNPTISMGLIGAGGIAGVHADAYLRLTDEIRRVHARELTRALPA